MADLKFDVEKCKGCALCVSFCPKKILRMSGKLNLKGYVYAECTDMGACSGCASCARMCPDVVIEVHK